MSFYLTLPSNTEFANNTAASFRCPLPDAVELRGPWEVGLASVQFPTEFINVENAWVDLYIHEDAKKKLHLPIPDGQYRKLTHLVSTVQEYVAFGVELGKADLPAAHKGRKERITLKYNSVEHRVTLRTSGGLVSAIDFSPNLGLLLGFERLTHYHPGGYNSSPESMRFSSTQVSTFTTGFNSLYIYSDIVESQYVGDTKAPLLRIVPMKITDEPYHGVDFSNVHYINLLRKSFNSVQITIKSSTGEPFPFISGRSMVKLHFRKKRLF